MNTLFYFDCLGHQQLKMLPYAVTRMGVTGLDGWMGHTPSTVMTTGAPVVLKKNQNNSNCLIPSNSPSLRALKWRSLWEDED